MDDDVKRRLGKYDILKELGRGGFATVYQARDTTLDRSVALKVLHPHVAEDQTFVQRFTLEAKTAAGFDHPNIVTIYEVGEQDGQHYIAMAYLPGRGLDQVLAEAAGPLSLAQVADITDQLAEALDYIHQRGAVHRDVKPANIMVGDDGRVTLLDFGIVRAADGTPLTTVGDKMGTPAYMSPEQANGLVVDHRSDIYALGVVVYQMCTGAPPFDAASPLVVVRLHADKAPPPPQSVNPSLPKPVARVVLKALAKDPDARYQRAGACAQALRQAVAADAVAADAVAADDVGRGLPWWAWGAGGVGVLGLVVGFMVFILGGWFGALDSPTPTLAPTKPASPMVTLMPSPSPTVTRPPAPTSTSTPDPTATPKPEPVFAVGVTQTRDSDGMVMVAVPGATFKMGSAEGDDGADSDEFPQHDVQVGDFWLDQTEVTNAQYARCVADGACDASAYADNDDFNGEDYPVVGVTWHDAVAYCAWAGARLPTEAEWEYAARGESGHIYPWGDAFDGRLLNFCDAQCSYSWKTDTYDDGYVKTAPVGVYPGGASWCQALDMAGNVWEWTSSLYQDYPYRVDDGREVMDAEGTRVVRGGSWFDDPSDARCANRNGFHVISADDNVGFRCARSSE